MDKVYPSTLEQSTLEKIMTPMERDGICCRVLAFCPAFFDHETGRYMPLFPGDDGDRFDVVCTSFREERVASIFDIEATMERIDLIWRLDEEKAYRRQQSNNRKGKPGAKYEVPKRIVEQAIEEVVEAIEANCGSLAHGLVTQFHAKLRANGYHMAKSTAKALLNEHYPNRPKRKSRPPPKRKAKR